MNASWIFVNLTYYYFFFQRSIPLVAIKIFYLYRLYPRAVHEIVNAYTFLYTNKNKL